MLLTKNEIKAVKKLVFEVVHKLCAFGRWKHFNAYGVDFESMLVWAVREQRLLSEGTTDTMKFNTKLDGHPLGG